MNIINFTKESLSSIWTTGAIVPSSRFLAKKMIKPIDFMQARVIVEFGAGNGVLTKAILGKMRSDAKLLCFEINKKFCQTLKSIQDDRFILIEDSAEHILAYMKNHDIKEIDHLISAIPFVILPEGLTYQIVKQVHKALKPQGLYVQYHYSLSIQKVYKKIFGNVHIHFVPLNIPPAFVMVCKKL